MCSCEAEETINMTTRETRAFDVVVAKRLDDSDDDSYASDDDSDDDDLEDIDWTPMNRLKLFLCALLFFVELPLVIIKIMIIQLRRKRP